MGVGDGEELTASPTGEEPIQQARRDVGGRIASAALILMFGTVLSRVLGLVREQLAAGRFGAGDEIAAFTVADNVGTLVYDLMVSGALQAALIPVLAGLAVTASIDRAELRRVAGTLLSVAMVGVGALALLGIVFAPTVVRLMTALGGEGEARGSETTDLTVTLVRWILPGVVLLGVGTVLMAVLHAVGRPTAPALALAARNAAVVVAILLFSSTLGVRSMALGTVIGAAAIVMLQLPPLIRAGVLPRPAWRIGHPAVLEVGRLYLPVFLGLLVSAAGTVIDRNLAWGAGEDALGAMRYATTLVQLALGLVAAAISLAALPTLARRFTEGDETAFRHTLARALAITAVMILPATVGLAAIGWPTVDLLFQHGATSEAAGRQITIALFAYLPGALAAAFDQVLIFAFYARRDTRTPVLVGVLAVGVYLLVALPLVSPLGMLGLVLANSAQWISHALVMWWLARRRFGVVGDRALSRTWKQSAGAAVAMGLLALGCWLMLSAFLPGTSLWREIVLVGVPGIIGATVYVLLVVRLAIPEVQTLNAALLGRFRPSR